MRTGCLVALAWLALASWAAAARANAVFETPFFSVTVSPESGGYEVLSRRQAGEQSGRRVLPLFEVEYRDCIAMYGKYGYDLGDTSEYVLHHLSMGRPLHYHNLPPHLY